MSNPKQINTIMFSIKCGVAVVLLLQVLASTSAFISTASTGGVKSSRAAVDTRCYANQKLADQSIKPSDLSRSGLGGFDLIARTTNKKFATGSGSAPAKGGVVAKKSPPKVVSSPPKKVTVVAPPKKITASKGGIKTNMAPLSKNIGKAAKSTSNDEESDPTTIPWSRILVSFFIPWRNPNSIFLYMLLAVSVLGKLNEHPQ